MAAYHSFIHAHNCVSPKRLIMRIRITTDCKLMSLPQLFSPFLCPVILSSDITAKECKIGIPLLLTGILACLWPIASNIAGC